jgi:hypothetical protein
MKKLFTIALVAAATLAAGVPTASAATREYEGTVVSVNRDNRTFRLRDAERGTVTIKVTGTTRFERVIFATLRAGARNVEATEAVVEPESGAVGREFGRDAGA